jgi:enoyl-CoA hydratase
MPGQILHVQKGRCLELTIDNLEHANAVSDDMAAELARQLAAAAEIADFVVLRGAGGDFCTGRMSMGQRSGERPEALARRHKTEVIFRCYDAFREAPVPVVGLVRGRAHGFGCAIAALCDITLAAETASFQIPEMAHHILPTMVMSALIDRVPRKALMQLVYSTEAIGSTTALGYGLVSKVVPDAELETACLALSEAILAAPRAALLGVKEYTRSAAGMAIRGAVDFAQNLHATVNSSSEMYRENR